ncbi:hypothetical protein A3F08_02655 [Candidatus Berkelbacteria bacterium RIFCSPHIGHO2_12_FULL_36_9]|uniref:Uncharacterized protein n=1 Tax=Candidatus Berkelbacteria bacterium RIFCSPHIGHO2_12_FULL_36_9 TaxID=1797469 RepID=A0A1F5EE43_9BACT|nr:MAG: hypothetical protein A3F08_02655 [Candidatus Berkelbacteria bacterium RIFCSPHIGHO2_12_FULL_36_9]
MGEIKEVCFRFCEGIVFIVFGGEGGKYKHIDLGSKEAALFPDWIDNLIDLFEGLAVKIQKKISNHLLSCDHYHSLWISSGGIETRSKEEKICHE